jgi:hypothetical protein
MVPASATRENPAISVCRGVPQLRQRVSAPLMPVRLVEQTGQGPCTRLRRSQNRSPMNPAPEPPAAHHQHRQRRYQPAQPTQQPDHPNQVSQQPGPEKLI